MKNTQLFRRVIHRVINELVYIVEDDISLKKIWKRKQLKKRGIAYSRYKLFDKKWLLDSNIQTVLDVGANIGEFTCIYNELFPSAEIHAFEPLPNCFTKLKKRAENMRNVNLYNIALGSKEEKLNIHESTWHPASSFREMGHLHKQNYPHSSESTDLIVDIRRLDDVVKDSDLKNNILIKMDVQGFEDEVIKGGENIFKKAKVIVVESSFQKLYENEPMFKGIYSLLQPLGFDFVGSLKQSINKEDGSFLQGDCIFLNSRNYS